MKVIQKKSIKKSTHKYSHPKKTSEKIKRGKDNLSKLEKFYSKKKINFIPIILSEFLINFSKRFIKLSLSRFLVLLFH